MAEGHNPFDFMRNRKNSVEPTQMDKDGFDLYMGNLALSMTPGFGVFSVLEKTNTMAFSQLRKNQQCMAFTSLDGNYIGGPWTLPKKEYKMNTREYIEKIMFVFDCSRSEAESMLNSGHINKQDIDACHATLSDAPKAPRKRK